MADASDDLGIPMKPVRPAAPGIGSGRAAAIPPRTPDAGRPSDATRLPDPIRRPPEPTVSQRKSDAEARTLIVGREITLSGEITSCDKLIVEGSVEANLANCRDIVIADSGLFKGSASIDDAEIRGRFEGNLVVRKRLLIKASGRVSGAIRYGQIEIECGGQISGDIQAQALAESGEIMPEPRSAA